MNLKKPVWTLSFIWGTPRLSEGVLSHLQKFSPFGFMMTWPFCFHVWIFWKMQEYYIENQYGQPVTIFKPGTEKGFYFRTPGYRWDRDLGMKWTWGYFGMHWD